MTQLTVYGPTISTYVRTVRMVLEETNTSYELQDVDIFTARTSEYLELNPFGKVPAMKVDGQILYETSAIVEYLNVAVADRAFVPEDPMGQARMRQIMSIMDNYLYGPAISEITIQRLIVPSQGGQPDEAAIQNAVPKAKTALDAIESISSCDPFLLGNTITLADFYLMPVVLYLSKTPEMSPVTAQTPKLKSWWDSIHQRPSFQKVIA
ncbi:MAG: glutathione S-transferase family protein [Cyanobacteria bacterium P01_F01_bin.150]